MPAAAQAARVTGRLLHARATDSVPLAGRVVLHRLSMAAQGAVDSTLTGTDGAFAFRVRPDTSAIFLLSSRFAGIEYFSAPLRVEPGAPPVALVVHDTSSQAPVRLAERYVLVSRATQGGRRSVLDLLILRNGGSLTRTARDSLSASWQLPLPEGAADVSPGEGAFSAAAFDQRGDTLDYLAPVLPGERQLVVRYTVPAGSRLVLANPPAPDSVVVLLEDRDGRVPSAGFTRVDSTLVEGQTFWRWIGKGDARTVEIAFAGAPDGRGQLPILVAALAIMLAGGLLLVFRRRAAAPSPGVAAAPAPDASAGLVEAIARLDAEFGGREAELDEPTLARYRAERARLRAELDRALAASGAPR